MMRAFYFLISRHLQIRSIKKFITVIFLLAATCGSAQVPFTPGNIVVCRVGDGTATLTNIANPVFLDEYTATGTLVQSIPIPTATLGSNYRLVLSGTALTSQEGNLTLSANKQFLILGGYDVSLGTTNPAVNSTSRVIAVIDHNGNVNTSTNLSDFIPNTTFKAVASSNGIDIWCAGNGGSGTTSGIHYTTVGSSGSTQLNDGLPSAFNNLGVADGQLYVSTRSSGYNRILAVGNGLPTNSGQTFAGLPGIPTTGEVNQFVFFDLNSSVPGADVLYYADETLGLQKYSLVGGTWVSNGTVGLPTDQYKGLTGFLNAGTVTLYAIRKGNNSASINGGQLVQLTDASGYNMAFTGTPTIIVSAAPINTKAFRGIALAPAAAEIPLPVKLINITANRIEGDVVVNWSTATETNFDHFEVERSLNTITFIKVGTQPSTGTTQSNIATYGFTDPGIIYSVPAGSVIYYRLKMVDKDGRFENSKIVAVRPGNEMVKLISAYPNPFDKEVRVKVALTRATKVIVSIYDVFGHECMKPRQFYLPRGENTILLPDAGKLSDGIYLLRVDADDAQTTIKLKK